MDPIGVLARHAWRRRARQAAAGEGAGGETALVEALRGGDESAFAQLVDQHHASMVRIARLYVRDRAAAEEVAQDTWLAVVESIDRFERRSTLRTWIFRILTNRAKTRGARDGRSVPLSALLATDAAIGEPSVDADRFRDLNDPRWPYHWAAPPRDWPEERALARETLELIGAAIEALPDTQREVIRLRDVEGWSAQEVCEVLEISEGNQRVLLHRARSKVRAAIERYMSEEAA